MRSKDFITKYFGKQDGKLRTCSSLLKDTQGNIYSFGFHYPLLFKVKSVSNTTLNFLNITGYSQTTRRHIGYCTELAEYFVKLPNGSTTNSLSPSFTIDAITEALTSEIKQLESSMKAKKRKDTNIYKELEYQYNDRLKSLKALMS